jgi:hypothetical protein
VGSPRHGTTERLNERATQRPRPGRRRVVPQTLGLAGRADRQENVAYPPGFGRSTRTPSVSEPC